MSWRPPELTLVLGFFWALILNQVFTGRTIVRSATILPWILPSTVTAFLWAWIFNGQFGLLNGALESMGLIEASIVWLADPAGALAAVVLAKVWLSTPGRDVLHPCGPAKCFIGRN